MKRLILPVGILAALALVQSASASDIESGKTIYSQRCASCHGALGAGDGAVAQALPPEQKPRNLVTGPMKFATDDDKLRKVIKEGGNAVGLSPLMPPQADMSPADLDSMVIFVKSLKK